MGGMLVDDVEIVPELHQPVGLKHLSYDPIPGGSLRTQKLLIEKVELFWSVLCFFFMLSRNFRSTLCFFGLHPVACSLPDPVAGLLRSVYLPLLPHLRGSSLLVIGENSLSHLLHKIVQVLLRLPARPGLRCPPRIFRPTSKERTLFFFPRVIRAAVCALFFIERTLFLHILCRVLSDRLFCRRHPSPVFRDLPLRDGLRRLRHGHLRDQLLVVERP